MPNIRKPSSALLADLAGGLTGAVAVLPQTIGLSVLLFTSMGMDASDGAVAGLIGAIVLLISSGLAGATTGMISAPNGPVTILLSGLVVKLAPHSSPAEILVVLSAVLFCTGVFEIIFGLLKGGELVKLIPYPVVTSMISAIGILMIKSQIEQVTPDPAVADWRKYIPLIVALVTLLSIYLAKRVLPRMPGVLVGLMTGVFVFSLLIRGWDNPDPRWVIGTLPKIELARIVHRFDGVDLRALPWELIITSALALTVLVTIDCLLTALVADNQTSLRHDSRKELAAQGIGQMIIGLVGGVGGGGTKGSTLANTMVGGRRWSPLFAALAILAMTLFGRNIGALLPLSALSGVIVFIGVRMINIDILLWLRDRRTRVDAINAILVIVATLLLDVTKAVGLGMVFAVVLFLRREVKRSLVRRQTNLCEYPSPRKRSEKHQLILAEHGDKGLLMELQGDLFFATTDQLFREVSKVLEGRLVIIFHFRRVLSLDMSGMMLLLQLSRLARKQGTEIVFCHFHKQLGFGKKMKEAFALFEGEGQRRVKIFHSTARALEYAEDQVLKNEYKDKNYGIADPVPFAENDLLKGFAEKEIQALLALSVKKEYNHKEVVVAKGEDSSSLYLVTSGFVEQRVYNGPVSYKVLAKYSPGTYFGKLTFLDPGPIAATFTAIGKTRVSKIRRADIEKLSNEGHEEFLAGLLFSIGKRLSRESVKLISEIKRLEAL